MIATFTVPPPPMRGRITVWVPPVTCGYCDGTGDVHRIDGEWLGYCPVCPRPKPDLPEGVWQRADGTLMFECLGCDRAVELLVDPTEFDPAVAYCGGSPRCIP